MKRLVLVGGGHSHLEVLRRLSLRPRTDLETVMLTPERHAIYSGMIPGVIAGDYAPEHCRVDLAALARRAGARLQLASAIGLDCAARKVMSSDGESPHYDLVSFDVGSTPAAQGVAGVREHAASVKPAHPFLEAMAALADRHPGEAPRAIVVVGSGAAGTELAFALWYRLNQEGAAGARLSLLSESPVLLPGLDVGTRHRALRIAATRKIEVRLGQGVIEVDATGLTLAGGERIAADRVVWATGAAAPAWIATTPLATDAAGFIAVNDALQSVSHPAVFAAGDCAGNVADPKPKSGVVAVRQGPVLAENLFRAMRGEPLIGFRSASHALAILNCGGRNALASWRGHAFEGRWVWFWKDQLDRRFMRRYALAGTGSKG